MNSQDQTLIGKTAIVTGAGRGIGRSIALALAYEGAGVLVNDVGTDPEGVATADSGPAHDVVDEIRDAGGIAYANTESVAEFESAGRIVAQALDAWGHADILVNVAGITRRQTIYSADPADWHRLIDVHLNGTFYMCRHVAPLMRDAGGGAILNTCSDAFTGAWGGVAYAAAKAGIWGLTNAIATQSRADGIRANCIAPIAETRLQEYSRRTHRDQAAQSGHAAATHNFDDVPGPEHVGPVAAYLVGDRAADLTGQMFAVRGRAIGCWSIPAVTEWLPEADDRSTPWEVGELSARWPWPQH